VKTLVFMFLKPLRVATLTLLVSLSAIATVTALAQTQRRSPEEIDREVDALLPKLTLEQKIELLGGGEGAFTYAIPHIGLPPLKNSDGPVGVRSWGPTTAYAAGIGLAASWDTAFAQRLGESLGRDARARGVNFLLGPGVNIYRAPMNGRNFEYFGEDPYLAGQIAAHYILGVQSRDVVATVKHYAANNSEYDRDNINAIIDERTLREIYLPVFEAAVKEGHVGAVMDSYNLVNGEYTTQNEFLDTEVLKKDWGFRGILMSDWGATHSVAAANAGLDLEMPSPEFMNQRTLLPAIKEGQVSIATIDDKVRRILRIAVEFGFLNHDQTELSTPLYNQESRAVALQSAEESLVLLKNEGHLLPLDLSRVHTITIIGPDAYPPQASAGGSANVDAFAPVSFLTGLSDAAPNLKVLWSPGIKDLSQLFGAGNFSTDEQGKHPGLRQEEFDSGTFVGKPDRVSVVPNVDHWEDTEFTTPANKKLAVRWAGYYTPPTSEATCFIAATKGGDSYRLYVNERLVLQGLPHRGEPQAAEIDLPASRPVSVRFDYLPDNDHRPFGLAAFPAADMLEPNVRKLAALGDVVVVSVGFTSETEKEGHDRTYELPPGQEDLIKAVVGANPHAIVVLTVGGSVATGDWLDRVPALLQTWYGGSEAGNALAAALLGRVTPSGKLPITWWRRVEDNPAYPNYYEEPGTHEVKYREGVFLGYRAVGKTGKKPLFPFGFGLSYTMFAFSHLSVTPQVASPEEPISVSFDVQNTGQQTGAEVAQVYVGDPSATVPRPEKELKGFERVELRPGETKHLVVKLNKRSLAYWDVNTHGWKVDPGQFVVYVGDASEYVPLRQEFTVR